ncbi:MAG TPA: peptide deformylase [Candidatus Paceibacterota bacterium]|jgi:peptide deformylase
MKDVIVQDGDPVLREVSLAVAEDQFGTPELAAIVDRMAAALDGERDGVAIAAPQIGIPLRIFVVRYDRLSPHPEDAPEVPDVGVYINPEFIRASRRRIEMDEGCLSVRRVYGKTLRHERASVRARLPDGRTFERGGGGILAQIFQHETDHLDGVLFIDHAHDLVEIPQEEWSEYRAERRARRLEKEGAAEADAGDTNTHD